jgi:Reverse transcriptase (RNA-dependent DNA polymerase)
LKKGLLAFGEPGTEAVSKELKQLDDFDAMEPIHTKHLTALEKERILNYLMFLKEKRSGVIKGRGCADGRPQCAYIDKDDATSPTVSTEAVFLTCTVDAKEERDVALIDVPGAFMQTDNDEVVHMRLVGTMADLLVQLNPDRYKTFVTVHKGKTMLVVRLKKALYGTIKAAYLFWKKHTADLVKWGFVINPYDMFVANKTINGKQCTVVWHVDDVKISHVDPNVVTEVIALFSAEYAKLSPLTISRGKIHEYLGMTLDYSVKGKVKISMTDYVINMLKELPVDMEGVAATPASPHLFTVNTENPTLLDTE